MKGWHSTDDGCQRGGAAPRPAAVARAGFSLLEMLVVIAIIAVLLGLLLPALSACRRSGKNLRCAAQMKQVAFEFNLFADDLMVRADGSPDGQKFFWLEDFQESLYRVHEYWDSPEAIRAGYDAEREVMMCPEGPRELYRRANQPCSAGAVFPRENISIAFNRRLHRPAAESPQVLLTSRILNHPGVPLAIDVDGREAATPDENACYVAPPLPTADGYEAGVYWFPSFRHGGRLNIAFVGGHVSSMKPGPLSPDADWGYTPN